MSLSVPQALAAAKVILLSPPAAFLLPPPTGTRPTSQPSEHPAAQLAVAASHPTLDVSEPGDTADPALFDDPACARMYVRISLLPRLLLTSSACRRRSFGCPSGNELGSINAALAAHWTPSPPCRYPARALDSSSAAAAPPHNDMSCPQFTAAHRSQSNKMLISRISSWVPALDKGAMQQIQGEFFIMNWHIYTIQNIGHGPGAARPEPRAGNVPLLMCDNRSSFMYSSQDDDDVMLCTCSHKMVAKAFDRSSKERPGKTDNMPTWSTSERMHLGCAGSLYR